MKTRVLLSSFFLIWLTLLLASFFIVQKPIFPSILQGIVFLGGTLFLDFLFVIVGAGLGYWVLSFLVQSDNPIQRLTFSTSVGMGMLGVAGFLLVAGGLSKGWIFLLILVIALFLLIWKKHIFLASNDLREVIQLLKATSKSSPIWIPAFALGFLFLSFLHSLAPPVEGFDGLFYHLTVPSLWLRDGGIRLVNIPHYWFPGLMEGMFVWPMSLGFDSSPQFFHLTFGLLACLLVWDLTNNLFGSRTAWWSLAILISMPSLPLLASWAYTDLGLVFYFLASAISLLNWRRTEKTSWLVIGGAMTGFALGIKYTSFVLPLVELLFLIVWNKKSLRQMFRSVGIFSGMALLAGGVWYLRNLLWMGNPIYPFLWGGPFWDEFRAQWYSGAGTGIGLNIGDLILLPLITTLGYRDQNYYDGRFGPFFLVLFPVALVVIWRIWREKQKEREGVLLFLSLSFAFILSWIVGVINTESLLQARLLWPGLFPLIPFLAAGCMLLGEIDLPRFRISYIFSVVMGLAVFVSLFDFGLLILSRGPLRVILGMESRSAYAERLQPGYAEAVSMVNELPASAHVYLLEEPRSYGMERIVQPDSINDNLPHDFFLYSSNIDMLNAWRELGYTHILARRDVFSPQNLVLHIEDQERLLALRNELIPIREKDQYILLEIPEQ